jgi:hypothetical protein
MRTLWIYGCSFSEPFGLLPTLSSLYLDEEGTRNLSGTDYWGTHLAKKLNLTCVTKSLSGIGWNYISHQIDLDVLKWKKDDIIIISPSFLSRINIMEFKENGTIVEDYIYLLKDVDELIRYNELRWKTKVKTLQHFGYNVFTWLVDNGIAAKEGVENLITTPEGYTNFKDWMDLHLEYWTDPTRNVYPEGDWHFNKAGHYALSEVMYEFINRSSKSRI